MANNYCQYSMEIIPATPEELAWWTAEREKDHEGDDERRYIQWEADGDGIWIYADEYGDLEGVVGAVQEFLQHFKRPDVITLEWASSCSKPRIGEFGGGAVVFDIKRAKWLNTGDWAYTTKKRYFEKRNV